MTPQLKAAREAAEKHPDTPTRTLARMLAKQRPKLFPDVESARARIRYIRGNLGKQKRRDAASAGHAELFRENVSAGKVYGIPDSDAKEWTPFDLGNGVRVLSISDIHIPYHDKQALTAAIDEGKRRDVDVVLINGDLIDFHKGSRFEQDPEARDMVGEVRLAAKFLLYLRQEFPDCRLVYKEGNHDERWKRYVRLNAPMFSELRKIQLDSTLATYMAEEEDTESSSLADFGWEYVTDQRPVMAGKLPILHGHELPNGMAVPVNPARGVFLRMVDTALIGHGHRTSHHVEGDWRHSEVSCWSQGCLCELNPEYRRINKWNHGAAVIDVHDDGEFDVSNFRIVGGKVRAS